MIISSIAKKGWSMVRRKKNSLFSFCYVKVECVSCSSFQNPSIYFKDFVHCGLWLLLSWRKLWPKTCSKTVLWRGNEISQTLKIRNRKVKAAPLLLQLLATQQGPWGGALPHIGHALLHSSLEGAWAGCGLHHFNHHILIAWLSLNFILCTSWVALISVVCLMSGIGVTWPNLQFFQYIQA